MSEETTVINERVDDIPLLLTLFDKMHIGDLLDRHFPTHGHWQGLSLGKVSSVWLAFILSQANHRLSHLQPWAAKRLHCLRACVPDEGLQELDFSDDRLALILDALGDDQQFAAFERELSAGCVRAYDLQTDTARIDTTTAKQFVEVTRDGLLQFGHSKEHRPDLPQLKVCLTSLDPFGLPVACSLVAGNRADDGVYVPQIEGVRQTLQRRGITYVRDSKMAALSTRAFVAAGLDYYLCPLSRAQVSQSEVEALVERALAEPEKLQPVYAEKQAPTAAEPIAFGYEYESEQSGEIDGREFCWKERRLVVLSVALHEGQSAAVEQRVQKAFTQVQEVTMRKRGKRVYQTVPELQEAVQKIIHQYKVTGLIDVACEERVIEKQVRGDHQQAARLEQQVEVKMRAAINKEQVARAKKLCGWRVYATNHGREHLSVEKAVQAYRNEYLVERGMRRFKDKPLSLTPVYLHDERRIKGLVRLLSVGLRALVLVEAVVRRRLGSQQAKVPGLYAGNTTRATTKPTTELMLKAFEGITLTLIIEGAEEKRYLSKLTQLQEKILQLLGFASDIYLRLVNHFYKPTLNLSET